MWKGKCCLIWLQKCCYTSSGLSDGAANTANAFLVCVCVSSFLTLRPLTSLAIRIVCVCLSRALSLFASKEPKCSAVLVFLFCLLTQPHSKNRLIYIFFSLSLSMFCSLVVQRAKIDLLFSLTAHHISSSFQPIVKVTKPTPVFFLYSGTKKGIHPPFIPIHFYICHCLNEVSWTNNSLSLFAILLNFFVQPKPTSLNMILLLSQSSSSKKRKKKEKKNFVVTFVDHPPTNPGHGQGENS